MNAYDPVYAFTRQAGRLSWLFAAFATWVLGFATWHVMYFLYSTANPPAIAPNLPGPDAFASVLVGDCIALPVMNAIIVQSYRAWEDIADAYPSDFTREKKGMVIDTRGKAWVALAAAIAVIGGVGIYASWFAAGKIDWSMPRPGTLNSAGIYHAVFLTVEIYVVTTFLLTTGHIAVRAMRRTPMGMVREVVQRERAAALVPLIRLFGAAILAADIFAIASLIDVKRSLLPLPSYDSVAFGTLAISCTAILIVCLGIYRSNLGVLLRDVVAPIMLIAGLAGAAIPLWILHFGTTLRLP